MAPPPPAWGRASALLSIAVLTLIVVPLALAQQVSAPFEDAYHQSGPPAIPGIVYAALYDLGGEGLAYHDTTPLNEGSDGLNRDPKHQRAHGSEYTWHFRAKEGADISFVKDWADLNHPNPVTPPINAFYLGWTDDGEWTRYTVEVREPGTYAVKAMYAHQANEVSFDLDGVPAARCKVPVASESYHHWNLARIGAITFPTAGRHVLTFHYGKGNNWMFFLFEKTAP
jgi:hypothetical protein